MKRVKEESQVLGNLIASSGKVFGLEDAKQASLLDSPCSPQHGAVFIVDIIITHLLLPFPRLRPLHLSVPFVLLKRPRRHLIQP